MISHPYSQMVRYKKWADHGLHGVVAESSARLNAEGMSILLRLMDHMHVVDQRFQSNLLGLQHAFHAS